MLVRDSYWSYQGTGFNTGIRQFFVRLAGCSIKCPIRKICDEQESLEFNGTETSTEELMAMPGEDMNGKWIHITGGEPLHYAQEILAAVKNAPNAMFQIQTSGMLELCGHHENTWITCSPKSEANKLRLTKCNEIVVVAHDLMTSSQMTEYSIKYPHALLWCSPVHGQSAKTAEKLIERSNCGYRLTGQLHKQWGIK